MTGAKPVQLRIGVTGFLPPQTAEWNRNLSTHIECCDIPGAARDVIPQMQAAGAQLIIALAHSGPGPYIPTPRMEHAATALAAIDGIDVVIAGHSHQVFPGPDIAPGPGIDPQRGALAGKPAVMAGFGGSHLGVIDLRLRSTPSGRMQVRAFCSKAQKVPAATPPAAHVIAAALPAHRATLKHFHRRVAYSETPLHSFFTLIGQDSGLRLVNMAQRWHIRRQLPPDLARLPILSAAAPFRAGGRGGPCHYSNIAAGTLKLRNLVDLCPFPNRVCAVHLTGTQLREWLERSASIFRTITPGYADQELTDPGFPSYNFDVIAGVEWQVDLSQPPRFSPAGELLDPQATRISHLSCHGQPVRPDDRFLLATSSYRMATNGLYGPLVAHNAVGLSDETLIQDVLREYIRRRRRLRVSTRRNWYFRPMPGTSVLFKTSPDALAYLRDTGPEIHDNITCLGRNDEGFVRLRLAL